MHIDIDNAEVVRFLDDVVEEYGTWSVFREGSRQWAALVEGAIEVVDASSHHFPEKRQAFVVESSMSSEGIGNDDLGHDDWKIEEKRDASPLWKWARCVPSRR